MKLKNIITEIQITNPKHDIKIDHEGTKRYLKKGTEILHRIGGPAIEYPNGINVWYQNGERHRLDGPAIEYANGTKHWYQNDKRHRLDGPAVEWANGDKEWYQNGKLHRLEGPAVEWSDGDKAWYINGKEYSEDEFNQITNKLNEIQITNPIKPNIGQKYNI